MKETDVQLSRIDNLEARCDKMEADLKVTKNQVTKLRINLFDHLIRERDLEKKYISHIGSYNRNKKEDKREW